MPRTVDLDRYTGWSLSQQSFGWVLAHTPVGGTILELGTGPGTFGFRDAGFRVVSVEDKKVWYDKWESLSENTAGLHLVYAPDKDNWYDIAAMDGALATPYDTLIIDGPETGNRDHMIPHLDKFNLDAAILLDNHGHDSTDTLLGVILERVGKNRHVEIIENPTVNAVGISREKTKWIQ